MPIHEVVRGLDPVVCKTLPVSMHFYGCDTACARVSIWRMRKKYSLECMGRIATTFCKKCAISDYAAVLYNLFEMKKVPSCAGCSAALNY